MCISKELSLASFSWGILGSLLLLYKGKIAYQTENNIIAYVFIYVAIMQLFDYGFWIDLDNKKGINNLLTIVGPIYLYLQPILLYFIITKETGIRHNWIEIIILFYLMNYGLQYKNYLTSTKEILTKQKGSHLKWGWINSFEHWSYHLFIIMLMIVYRKYKWLLVSFILLYIFLGIQIVWNPSAISELWCFVATGIPLIIYGLQKLKQ